MIIDSPSPYAPTYEWEEFLAEMKSVSPQTDDTRRAIKQAEAELDHRNDLMAS